MPELPEVAALAAFLRDRAVGRAVVRTDVAALSAVKTFDPPLTVLHGAQVSGARRYGKFLSVEFAGPKLHLIAHLSRAGWLQWRDNLSSTPPKLGRGPLALRVHLAPEFDAGPASGFDLTEAGTKKRLAVYLVNDPLDVPGIARLGPDALAVTADELAAILGAERSQLKRAITNQSVLAGIGNAYSDEILHAAKLSPFKLAAKLTAGEISLLHKAIQSVLTDAIARSTGQKAATLKGEKRSGLQVHARAGLPCPVCGDTIGDVSFADRSFQYCPTCQTEGRSLADRRLSRLLK
ncbi:MAG: DNA-formamidopyrimidine glycosylase family protein [Jatrophihabitantaceae bacterium]